MQHSEGGILLKVSYRVPIHQVGEYEQIFRQQLMPLVREKDLQLVGIWKTLVGNVGEFLELWQFRSLSEFEAKWPSLLGDPRFQEILQKTGPMVEQENFTLLQPALQRGDIRDNRRLV